MSNQGARRNGPVKLRLTGEAERAGSAGACRRPPAAAAAGGAGRRRLAGGEGRDGTEGAKSGGVLGARGESPPGGAGAGSFHVSLRLNLGPEESLRPEQESGGEEPLSSPLASLPRRASGRSCLCGLRGGGASRPARPGPAGVPCLGELPAVSSSHRAPAAPQLLFPPSSSSPCELGRNCHTLCFDLFVCCCCCGGVFKLTS